MENSRRKKVRNITIGILVVVILLACGTGGIVCERKINTKGELTIGYESDVDTGEGSKTTRTKVSEAEFFTCQMNDKWPDCKKEAKNWPDLPDAPMNDKYKQYNVVNNQKSRLVCVDSMSKPDSLLTNLWQIGKRTGQDGPEEQGIFQMCFMAEAGQKASIRVLHSDRRHSTVLCTVWMFINGKKHFLDWAFSQRLAPCKAEARIP